MFDGLIVMAGFFALICLILDRLHRVKHRHIGHYRGYRRKLGKGRGK